MKCIASEEVPANEGLMRPIKVLAPAGSIVNANPPAAVAGGNVETSQRIVDVLFRALAPAAPIALPPRVRARCRILTIGGFDRFRDRHFSYYETIAGGAGASRDHPGASGIHTHMTNTLNTPIEALETYYPMRVTEYRMRRGSGGRGSSRGGDGSGARTRMPGRFERQLAHRSSHHSAVGPRGWRRGRAGCELSRARGQAQEASRKNQRAACSPAIGFASRLPVAAAGAASRGSKKSK